MTFGDRARGRDNHFNLIRVLAAAGVLVSHAWPISLGEAAEEPLSAWIGTSLGRVAVLVFFAVSDFFIAQSFDRGGSLARFVAARALRIFPGLLVVLLLTVAAAALATSAPAAAFWAAAPEYLLRNLTLVQPLYPLPGLFENNPYPGAINGSLWTLVHEVACYACIAAAGLLGLLRPGRIAALAFGAAFVALALAPLAPLPPRAESFAGLALPFALGSAAYVWRSRVPISLPLGAALVAAAGLSIGSPAFPAALALAIAYVALACGFAPAPALLAYNRVGDISYGLYIYAFPVQQSVAALGVTEPALNIALALPVTAALAALSWRLVERPALELKPTGPRPGGPERSAA